MPQLMLCTDAAQNSRRCSMYAAVGNTRNLVHQGRRPLWSGTAKMKLPVKATTVHACAGQRRQGSGQGAKASTTTAALANSQTSRLGQRGP
jgi:hypothetical protein